MRAAFTGAHSIGKTTLLNECKKKYPDYIFVDEVTRVVKRNYGININEGGDTETQLYILAEHIKNHLMPGENILLDRCILDGYCYTKYQVLQHKVTENILSAYSEVFSNLFDNLDIIFYPNAADVKLVSDGERSTNVQFRVDMVNIFEEIITYKLSEAHRSKIIKISGTVEERLQTIEKYLK